MPITDPSERAFLGWALFALGCSLAGLAAVLGARAIDHMTASANMCVADAGHCVACAGALGCLAAALFAARSGLSLLQSGQPNAAAC